MRTIASLLLLSQSGLTAAASADTSYETLAIPFPFYNESFGFAAGYVYGRAGWPEPQSRVLGTVMAGTRGSAMLLFAGQDLRTPWLDRLFIDPFASVGYFGEIEAYINGNPEFPDQDAGRNDSDEDNFVQGEGFDNFARVRFHYLLPIGHGRDQVVPRYDVVEGLAVGGFTGARSLNPLESGRSFVDLRPFYRSQEIDGDDLSTTISTNGVDVGLDWDNRDFPPSPARGQSVSLGLSRDFGLFDSSGSWTVVQGEVDQYFELERLPRVRQAVVALNAWTANTPSWDDEGNGKVDNRPPAYAGATLGGLWRMRAYPSQRFNDRAAIYYAAELRVIPEWNPFDAWPAFQSYADVEWLQFVPFIELGRVAPEWDLGTLHSSMNWSVGLGIRAWASGFVVRVDTGVSEEGAQVQMMISQPFQFF
ncbi:MAG TPA: hypothetical protein VFZ10_14660 [Geminicoccaceae bacterium]